MKARRFPLGESSESIDHSERREQQTHKKVYTNIVHTERENRLFTANGNQPNATRRDHKKTEGAPPRPIEARVLH
jgi:hypothetical protein